MVPTTPTKASAAPALRMRVEGMDCSACTIKVENALKRLSGLSDILRRRETVWRRVLFGGFFDGRNARKAFPTAR